MLADMALYMNNGGAANDGMHSNIPNMIWWGEPRHVLQNQELSCHAKLWLPM